MYGSVSKNIGIQLFNSPPAKTFLLSRRTSFHFTIILIHHKHITIKRKYVVIA